MNTHRLMTAHDLRRPELSVREQHVAFGPPGYRSRAYDGAFNVAQILATQVICKHRPQQRIATRTETTDESRATRTRPSGGPSSRAQQTE